MRIDKRLLVFSAVMAVILGMLAASVIPMGAIAQDMNAGWNDNGQWMDKWGFGAKNVIVFVGDGMGPSTVTAARWYKTQNNMGPLYVDSLPYTAVVTTESANSIVTDSAPAATALFSGHETNNGMINWYDNKTYRTILDDARDAGLSTGLVTTTRITHATPAGCYARIADRDDELTIARQLYDANVDVIMGGGRQFFLNNTTADPESGKPGKRTDANLVEAFKAKGYKYVWNESAFQSLGNKGKVLALFEPSHMQYEADRAADAGGEPSLAGMTEKAIRILSQDRDGYFLMVEGGRIDHASHEGKAYKTVTDTIAFDDAVAKAAGMVDLKDTLIIVVADHSHTLTIGGYPSPDTPILGTTQTASASPLTYPVISFGTGNRAYVASEWTNVTPDKELVYPAASLIGEETHGGETVNAYAIGPKASGVHGTMHLTGLYDIAHDALLKGHHAHIFY